MASIYDIVKQPLKIENFQLIFLRSRENLL